MKCKQFISLPLVAMSLALAPTALATTWYVNGVTGSDSNNCLSATTACKTIGHAISLASPGGSIIVAAATYTENLSIGKNLNILGSGCTNTVINGGGVGTVVTISSATVATRSGLSISGGSGTAGGGIYNSGTLILNNSCVDGNHLYGARYGVPVVGGGIYNASVLTINDSAITGNTATGSAGLANASGGGIYNQGRLTINRSIINVNSATFAYTRGFGGATGGGISNYGYGTLAINNTTLIGNSAKSTSANASGGGGIYNGGTQVISNTTISGNSADFGGGIAGSATLQNTIVANSPKGGNCSGTMTSKGYNLSSDSTCHFNGPGDLNNTDPGLGQLGSYGGPTETVPLLSGSPAIDAGNPNGCTDNLGHLLKTDQRGQPRPDPEDTGGCDMGAFERQSD